MRSQKLTRSRIAVIFLLSIFQLSAVARSLEACHDGSPLILDLDGGGIFTTDLIEPVAFDLDGDGWLEQVGWTRPETEDGFLWLDLDRDRRIDGGAELFGDASLLPDGRVSEDGFDALATYDQVAFGGNEDGRISKTDLIWPHLEIWVDRNHDGLLQARESRRLSVVGIESISLTRVRLDRLDGNLNVRRLAGHYELRVREHTSRDSSATEARGSRFRVERRTVEDVYFRIKHPDPGS